MLSDIKGRLEGFKTYIVLTLWLLAELAHFMGWIDDSTIMGIRALVVPMTGITLTAKLNRFFS